MISTMRPDIDNMDEYVRNTTARAFAVVASALGIPSLLPFLKAVCKSKKSWQARHTGIKIVQQIAILMGCAILPHLRSLVEIIEHGQLELQLEHETQTALKLFLVNPSHVQKWFLALILIQLPISLFLLVVCCRFRLLMVSRVSLFWLFFCRSGGRAAEGEDHQCSGHSCPG